MSIRSNFDDVYSRIKKLDSSVEIIAVSKTKPIELIDEACFSGIKIFGENKIKEGIDKFTIIKQKYSDIQLHHIGPVQSGTLKKLFGLFDYTHGVSSISNLIELSKQSEKSKKELKFFLQVNLTEEETKSGFYENEIEKLIPEISNYETEFFQFQGFMTIGPSDGNKEITRKVFKKLNTIKNQYAPNSKLSMGMSDDYEIALEEGTNFIRIGSAIFGRRS